MVRARHFMGWERPLVEVAAEALARGRDLCPLDLGDVLVVVPTAHSGRRLRERLAALAAEAGGAVLPGEMVTPAQLLATPANAATRLAAWMAWIRVLEDLDPEETSTLLPCGPGGDFTGLLSTARRLAGVCDALGEGGLTPLDAARELDDVDDPLRWEDLAGLHQAVCGRLEASGLVDRNLARLDALDALQPPTGVAAVAVFGVADPMPLAVKALARLAEEIPVEIHVHAPEELRDAFDPWGRPLPDFWEARRLPMDDQEIHLAAKPVDQAAAVGQLMDRLDAPLEELVIGMPEPSLAPALSRELEARGATPYDPGGRPLAGHRIAGLVTDLCTLLRQGSAEAFARLLRHPDFLASLRGDGHDPAVALETLDRVRGKHLPESFQRLVEVAKEAGEGALIAACDKAIAAVNAMKGAPLPEALRGVLAQLYRDHTPGTETPRERSLRDGAVAVQELLGDLEVPGVEDAGLSPAETASLLTAAMEGRRTRVDERPDTGVDLVGWLELQWDDAPTLILAGMNDGLVPEAVTGDAFLPDGARTRLGLSTNRERFARDAYLLNAMYEWRRSRGGLHMVVGRTDDRGDPLRPSRLLFLCDDKRLPARTIRLFDEVEELGEMVRRTPGELLRPHKAPPPRRLSVTSFKDYLSCPFRFYLRHVLGMRAVDDRKREMDPMDFGNLCHRALEAFGRSEAVRDSEDPKEISSFLQAQAEALVHERYGASLSAPVRVQLDAARQRLAWAAEVQAAERRAGWRIIEVEYLPGDDAGVVVAGMPVRGKVDRIDRHDDGRIRVLDYKTSETTTAPIKAHLTTLLDDDPPWSAVDVPRGPKRWKDLQLPLYALLLEGRFGGEMEVGYFHLPRAVRETGVVTWPELSSELLEAARVCAEGIVEAIRGRVFWPPRRVKYDDFEGLFFGRPEEVVDGDWMLSMARDGEVD